jgi:glycosyltransferase involved in cell wall biosynthesis
VVKNAVSETLGQPVFGVALHTASQPVIGYLGALESWFDASAIRAAAIARPNWRFVLVGRIESRNVRLLADLPNVEFMGEIGRERVPEVLARFDVATIPFLLNPLTVAADPIKLYEYLSAGLPVVSSRLPETERFARFIHYYDAPADFVHAVEAALLDGDESLRRQRRQAVKNETWEVRCRLLLDLTESLALTPAVQSSLRA